MKRCTIFPGIQPLGEGFALGWLRPPLFFILFKHIGSSDAYEKTIYEDCGIQASNFSN